MTDHRRPFALAIALTATIALAGPAAAAQAAGPITAYDLADGAFPQGIAFDRTGTGYIANQGDDTVTRIAPDGAITQAWAALPAGSQPYGITADASGNVYTANYARDSITKITSAGHVTGTWATVPGVTNLVADNSGRIYATSTTGHSIARIDPDATTNPAWAQLPDSAEPENLLIDPSGNIWSANFAVPGDDPATVTKISPAGTITATWDLASPSADPEGITIDTQGNVYISNSGLGTISRIDAGGTITPAWATLDQGSTPYWISTDDSGAVYAADQTTNNIVKISTNGDTSTWASIPGGPLGLATDNNCNLWTTSYFNSTASRIRSELPCRPTNLTATAGIASAALTWTPPTNPGTTPITEYTVRTYLNNTAVPASTCITSATTCAINGLNPGSNYTFTVTAANNAGAGPAAGPITAAPTAQPTTTPPATPAITISHNGKFKGKGRGKTLTLRGTTSQPNRTIHVYRSGTRHGKAALVATLRSHNGNWKSTPLSLGKKAHPYFCARTGAIFTGTIRITGKATSDATVATRTRSRATNCK